MIRSIQKLVKRRTLLPAFALVLLAQSGFGPAAQAESNPATTTESQSTGDKPVLDPNKYFGKAKAGYEAAKQAPEICAKLFCYCGCDLTDDHGSLLDCFTSDHGVDCFICQEEALIALKMKQQGKTLAEIQKTIDLAYTKEYPWDENSPAYKKYLAAKLWQGSAKAELDKARSQGGASSLKDAALGKPAVNGGKTSGSASGTTKTGKGSSSAKGLSQAEAAKRATKGSCCGGHPAK